MLSRFQYIEYRECPAPAPFRALTCHFTCGDLDPDLTHGSLGPPESTCQTASLSVQPLLQAHGHDRQTDRQTEHAASPVEIGHGPHLAGVVMQLTNNNNNNDIIRI